MHRKTAALFGALLLAASTAAYAQRGTQAEQDACTPDVFRLCQDLIPDEGQIVACLKEKHAQLSAACEPVMFPPSEAAKTAATGDAAPRKARHKHKKKHRSKAHE